MKKRIKTALVVEGGGMRGVFAAGVLDCFLDEKFDPFDIYIGVSAGACNLASHLGEQHGRNYRSFTDYMLNPEFYSIKKFLLGGHYMDLDWLWDHFAENEPLNIKKATKKEFYVALTNVETGRAEYLRADVKTIFDALKGSSALPLMYRHFVTIDGSMYIDGGMADSIPVIEAYKKGARRIMVIRSQLKGYRKKGFFESKFLPLLFRGYPSLGKALRKRESQYNEALYFIKDPPANTKIEQVCPSVIRSKRTTKDREKLELDYAEGKRMGRWAVQEWKGK